MQKIIITLGSEKTPFFRRKLLKIAENCDHKIDPWPFLITNISL
jgi:hypothetical protein